METLLPPLPYTDEEEEVGVVPRPRCTGGVVERAGRLSDPPPPTPPNPLPTPLPPAMVVLENTEAIEVVVGVGVGVLELALVCLPV